MTVLLISSFRPMSKPLKRGLEEEGYRVDLVEDYQGEHARTARLEYDCLVVDLMPHVHGGLLLRKCRESHSEVPIVALTVDPLLAEEVPLMGNNMVGLRKPFRWESLLGQISRFSAPCSA